ncbi:MAG TPA: FAD-dependent oxidoreductase [Sphingomicrobium sp.]|nr:FAD-dependent oxidoreductase [Sphingomicrobium sp.]
MSDFDIVIVGGGIAGASLGAEVADRRRTLIIEGETQCGYHATGRSAAFWLESYGGTKVALLSRASRAFLDRPPEEFAESGFLHARGAVHLSDGEWPEVPDRVEARQLDRNELERLVPGIRPRWTRALLEPGCADIDVAGLHAAYLRRFRMRGGTIATNSRLIGAERRRDLWRITLQDGSTVNAAILVDAAGAWADPVAKACGVQPLGVAPKRRTMVQLRVGRSGLRDLPLVDDSAGTFYFKGEGDRSVWLSPHDEIETQPCDAAPDEIDIAVAIDRFEGAVDWSIERVERSWAGLRSFAPDRLPVYGFDAREFGFFWCAGQGGFGIQTSPAAAKLAASIMLDERPDAMVGHIDPAIFSPARFSA